MNERTVVYDGRKARLEAVLDAPRKGGVSWRGRPSSTPGPGPSWSIPGGSGGGKETAPSTGFTYR
jgi:hypothetical protein